MNANLQQLIRDDSLCYKLAAELHYLIEHAPFQQEKLDLILLEFLACNQQKSGHLLHLMRACNCPDLIEQLSSDASFMTDSTPWSPTGSKPASCYVSDCSSAS